eukprot:Protomagalhaensia_wolfi_Nauph_80__4629@NODE_4788_length_505_cov_2339_083691_g3864_i0_p1_GENE_NODE_4788_length_505_cov_2339_083691_g3864_i0NODE_4788_length_505_cov_2339_083691_g3864_i0_p1_ORF_typecomplete_len112_score14_24_NODE_4788_length_505_cov_2339_083691_g3864_i075410
MSTMRLSRLWSETVIRQVQVKDGILTVQNLNSDCTRCIANGCHLLYQASSPIRVERALRFSIGVSGSFLYCDSTERRVATFCHWNGSTICIRDNEAPLKCDGARYENVLEP